MYNHVGKQRKWLVFRASLKDIGWTPTLTTAFQNSKNSITNRVTLSYCDAVKHLSIYSDSRSSHCSGIITYVPYDQGSNQNSEHRHDSSAVYSGHLMRLITIENGFLLLFRQFSVDICWLFSFLDLSCIKTTTT